MAMYDVLSTHCYSKYYCVEADSEDEAIEKCEKLVDEDGALSFINGEYQYADTDIYVVGVDSEV